MSNGSGNNKGPVLAFVGIGCLVLVVVAVVGIAILINRGRKLVQDFTDDPAATVAELVIKRDPTLEFISSDKEKGTITFREKKSGKETTISWDKIEEGKFTVKSGDETIVIEGEAGKATATTPEGTIRIGDGSGLEKFPKWFELPEAVTGWKAAMRQERANGQFSGSMIGESTLPVAELAAVFEKKLEAAGFAKTRKSESENHSAFNYADEATKRSVAVTLFRQVDKTGVSLGYEQK